MCTEPYVGVQYLRVRDVVVKMCGYIGLARSMYIYGVYVVFFAGNSPNIRSCTILAGQAYTLAWVDIFLQSYAIEWLMSTQLLTGGEGNSAAGAITTKKRHGRTFCVGVHIDAVRTPLNG